MTSTGRDTTATADAKRILNGIRRLVRALRSFEKQAQSRFGFGAAQMFILHVLAHEGEISLTELADRTATDQSSASLAVGKLVDIGYVQRATHEADRRQVRLSLTAKGRALARKAPPAAQEKIMESVQSMPRAHRTLFMALLDQLVSGMPPVDSRQPPMLFQDEEGSSAPRRRGARRVRASSRR